MKSYIKSPKPRGSFGTAASRAPLRAGSAEGGSGLGPTNLARRQRPAAEGTTASGRVGRPGGAHPEMRAASGNKERQGAGWRRELRSGPRPHLVHRAARKMQRPEEQLEFHSRGKAVEAEADVIDDSGGEQGRDAGRRPQLVRGTQLVVQPQARVALPHGRHLGGRGAREPASYADDYVSPARTPNMAAPVGAGRGLVPRTSAVADGRALPRLLTEARESER